jgi:hypothetical protein
MSVLKFTPRGILRETIDFARRQDKSTLADFTVLAVQNDPFRRDTPAGHRDGQWFKEHAERLYGSVAYFHLRGIHYRLLGTPLPSNGVYENTDKCWQWLSEDAAKAARWLGYVPFTRIVDARNDEPDVVIHDPVIAPQPYCQTDLIIPDFDEVEIRVEAGRWRAHQPWQIVIFGEKSSLKEPMMRFHSEYGADLYVGAGELSDTLIYNMARRAVAAERRLAVICLSDFDPSGRQMPVSIAWKLEALRVLEFTTLDFRVKHVGLTLEQTIHYDLPSTPLKDSEIRGERWVREFGRQQTEIDSLLALHPGAVQDIVRDAIRPYYDDTLTERINAARDCWLNEAQEIVDDATADEAGPWMNSAQQAIEDLDSAIRELDNLGRAALADADLPSIEVPEAELDEPDDADVLASSDWPLKEIARRLKERKAYGDEDEAA